jgi:hypothetical protein
MKKIVSLGTAAALLMALFATTTIATAKKYDCTFGSPSDQNYEDTPCR